ncbi:hypothetical protein ACJMK2_027229 [Sinanodonta woodiana]|uniref:PR domain zinc finger protein 10 n=1 Tax=Sinanodonta woodiana TaxID=1069815 RepID=A0ABD3XM59_SINWO
MDDGNQAESSDSWNTPMTTTETSSNYTSHQLDEASSSMPSSSTSVTFSSLTPASSFVQSEYRSGRYSNEAGVRAHYSGAFEITGSNGEVYQAPESSYERISPVDEYRDVTSVGDSLATYAPLASDVSSFATPQPVDSSTLSQSGYQVHHLVVDSENRVLAVQRVISPDDHSVSQSSTTIGQSFVPMHVTSLSTFSSNSEVTTSGRRLEVTRHERDNEAMVSSISGSGFADASMLQAGTSKHKRGIRHLQQMEVMTGEPDTTQDDSEDYDDTEPRAYLEENSSMNDAEPMLHSTMTGHSSSSLTTASEMEQAIDSSQLSSSHIPSSHLVRGTTLLPASTLVHLSSAQLTQQLSSSSQLRSSQDPPMNLTADSVLDSSMDRTVDSSAMVDQLSHHICTSMTGYVLSEDSNLDSSTLGESRVHYAKDDEEPGTSYGRRKSHRLAEQENEIPSWHRPQYRAKAYNPNDIWCEECMTTYEGDCPTHPLTFCPDKIVFSRAWASLPSLLQIFRLGTEGDLGVFSKRMIPKFTQFGPFVAEVVDSQAKMNNTKFPLMVERQAGEFFYYETSDENKCNWMMFVRPADTFAEQNLVAYQHGPDIFFSVTKTIEAKQELKVWYAAHYAERLGKKRLEVTQEDIDVLDQQECKFPCFECSKRFKTAVALQKHLISHDEGISEKEGDSEPLTQQQKGAPRQKRKRPAASLAQRANKLLKATKDQSTDMSGPSNYHWKKRSTNIYLNKTLKKYQKRHDSQAMRRNIQSLYRQTGTNSGGNEWVCTHCDLTFDHSNLLNLHTLTHAAEDVGLDEIRKLTYQPAENGNLQIQDNTMVMEDGTEVVNLEMYRLACPVCHMQFDNKKDLIDHAAEHGKSKSKEINYHRPFKCERCWKSFTSVDRLQRHLLCHGNEDDKPLQCQVCYKRFMNNSALACHMKTHSEKKYYECPICHQGFDQTIAMREHSIVHTNDEGKFTCPACNKKFSEFLVLKKHIRGFHSNRCYPCPECEKVFPRPDKLKLHMLRHSSHREFMCETCGRQFKRKDKLKEHIRRMHSEEREAKDAAKAEKPLKKFIPKVSPTDYHRFIYKCHLCLLGFKRRGMLVNHLAKKHPDVKPDSVPELNLPILKTQRDYYCQYCDKVYKSSSKRKAHIIKNHPGADLPLSSRKKIVLDEIHHHLPNPTFSQTVGSITTMPHGCEYCHKQYASKAKLTQHQRKKHTNLVPPAQERRKFKDDIQPQQEPQSSQDGTTIHVVERYDHDGVVQSSHGQQHEIQADLLTQAMSELTQTLQEYRQTTGDQTYHLSTRLGHGPPTVVQIQTPSGHIGTHSTIELAHLSQALSHAHFTSAQGALPVQIVSAAPPQGQVQQNGTAQVLDAEQSLSPQPGVSSTQGQPLNLQSVAIVSAAYVPRTWTNYTNYR